MRWQRLFADLEGEARELAALDRDAEISERIRAEMAAVRWLERLRGTVGSTVSLGVVAVGPVRAVVRYVGPDWVLLDDAGSDALVPAHAVIGLEGVARSAPADTQPVPLTWAAAWRTLSRDRAEMRLTRTDGTAVSGTVGQVGADFVELERSTDDQHPSRARLPRLLVPFRAICIAYTASEPEL